MNYLLVNIDGCNHHGVLSDQLGIDSEIQVGVTNDMSEYPWENVDRCEHFENLFPSLYLPLKYFLYSSPSNTNDLRKVSMRMDVASDCSKSVLTKTNKNHF